MLIELQSISLKQGDSWAATLTLTEDDGTTAIDLTGWSVEFSVAKDRRKAPAWSWVDSAPHASITDAAGGEISLALLPVDSRAFGKLEVLSFEVTIEDAGGYRLTVMEGEFNVRLEVVEGVAP